MSKKKLNCAVIGMGVGEKHAIFYLNYKKTKLLKVFEKDKKKVQKLEKKYPEINFVKTENDIFKDPKIDLISIASYDNYHYSQVIKATKYKKNIFVEKPVCLFLNELQQINKKVKKSNIKLSCNFVLRENSQFKKIKTMQNRKVMGNIYFMEADYNYGRLHKINKGWRGKMPFYSVTHGGAIHMIDLVLWYLKELPYEVKSSGNKIVTKKSQFKFNDFSIALLKFKSGIIVKVSSNFGCVLPHHHGLKIFGNKGTVIHDLRGAIKINSREKGKRYKKFNYKTNFKQKSNVMKNFVDALILNKTKKLKKDFNTIMNSMLISLAIEKSMEKNKTIKLNYKNLKLNA